MEKPLINTQTMGAVNLEKKDTCFVVAGSVDSGKSSLIGVLTTNQLDDGKGLARATVAKHPHEVTLGKTSDISTRTINLGEKNVTLVDLCGHEKYLKTTLYGITGQFPDYGILVVSANRGLLKMTKEHMGILLYMKIPFIILITRVDLTPENIYKDVISNITNVLKRYKRKMEILNSYEEFRLSEILQKDKEKECLSKIDKIVKDIRTNHYIVPILTISNKTGYYIDVVKYLLGNLESREVWNSDSIAGSIFYIDSKFTPTGIGLVVSGLAKGKTIGLNNDLLIGPFGNEFRHIRVWSLHNNLKEQVALLSDRQRGCLAIKSSDKNGEVSKDNIRKGMIIISKEIEQNICYEFTADIEILNHSTVISKKYTPVIHSGIVRQSARIILEENQTLKMGDHSTVKFRFVHHPEFLEKGSIFFFREGTTRGVGNIIDILSIKDDPNPFPAEQKKRKFHKNRRHRQNKNKEDFKGKKMDNLMRKNKIEII